MFFLNQVGFKRVEWPDFVVVVYADITAVLLVLAHCSLFNESDLA